MRLRPGVVLLCILVLTLVAVWFASRVTRIPFRRGFSPHFFVLGIAFLLLETRSLVTFSLLFGTTWSVNALVFFAILVSVLGAVFFISILSEVQPEELQDTLVSTNPVP